MSLILTSGFDFKSSRKREKCLLDFTRIIKVSMDNTEGYRIVKSSLRVLALFLTPVKNTDY